MEYSDDKHKYEKEIEHEKEHENEHDHNNEHQNKIAHDNTLLKVTAKITTISDVLLLGLSFALYTFTLFLDRYSNNMIYIINYDIFPGILLTPIVDIAISRNFCEEPYFNIITSQYFPGVINDASESKYDIDRNYYSIYDDKNICIKRFDKINFSNIAEYKKIGNPCSIGKRQCGLISNTYKNKICIDEKYECPINKLSFINDDSDLFDIISQYKYESSKWVSPNKDHTIYKLGTKFLIAYKNETNNEIPIKFKVAIGLPCVEGDRFELGKKENIPKNMEDKELYGCLNVDNQEYYKNKGYDLSLNYLDHINAKNFLEEADLYRKLIKLQDIDSHYKFDFESYKMNLYYFTEADRDYNCGKEKTISTDVDYIKYIELLANRGTDSFIRILLFLINIIFLIASITFATIVKLSLVGFYKFFLLFKTLIEMIFSVLMIIYSLDSKTQANSILSENLIKSIIIEPECFPNITVEKWNVYQMNSMIVNINTLTDALIYMSIIYSAIVFIQSIRTVIKFYYYLRKKSKSN